MVANKFPRVAFQGERGAFSELAALEFFGCPIEINPQATFEQVFKSVESEESDFGIIPIENSLSGSIHQNYDLLLERDLAIVGEIKLRIVHNLIVNKGVKFEEVRRIYSHPQALVQCKGFLQRCENIEVISTYDTAGAARLIKEKGIRSGAAIASSQAVIDYDLEIIREGIEDDRQNYTRFLVLSKEGAEPGEDAKTSIVFSMKNIPGALFKCLSVFALRDIDLLKIESRLLLGSTWQYLFYLDFDGSIRQEHCRRAIDHLGEITTFLRIWGSYPKGKQVDGRVHRRKGSSHG